VRFHVEVWDPDFRGSADTDLEEPKGARVELDVELLAAGSRSRYLLSASEGITVAFVDEV
jgi:hypothetical protein